VTVIEKEMQSRPAVEEYWVPLLLDSNEVDGQFRGQQIVIYNTSTQDKLHMIYYITQLLVYIIFFSYSCFTEKLRPSDLMKKIIGGISYF
jgi:hypothetical protein